MAPSPQSRRGKASPFLQRFDRNQDGKVTREEFDGAPRRFRALDLNGDGSVSKDEAAQAGPTGAERRRSADQGRRGGRQPRGSQERNPAESPGAEEPMSAADPAKEVRADAAWKELPPSFVFILADDMGWTGLSTSMDDGVPGSKSDFYQTPRIDELARQGMRFSNAYSPSSMCTPSRSSEPRASETAVDVDRRPGNELAC
jgi:hypothetical protein